MRTYIVLLSVILGLVACAQKPPQPSTIVVTSTVTDPDRIRFQGKGAGAGMMLSGSMGPMGIAIGVAIDEGIGKEIDATAMQANVKFTALFENKLREFIATNSQYADVNNIAVTIERYGFMTQSGDNDPVSAEIKAHFIINQQKYIVDYPTMLKKDSQNKNSELPTQPLATIKKDAKAIQLLFNNSIDLALTAALQQ